METHQINKILASNPRTQRFYRGCFASDQLPDPSTLKYPSSMVVNLDPQHLKGSHWIAIFATGMQRDVIYFDSLALPINPTIEGTFLSKFPRILKCPKPFQNPLSDICGHYCITMIFFLSNGLLFPEFIQFLENSNNPDLLVSKFVKEMLD